MNGQLLAFTRGWYETSENQLIRPRIHAMSTTDPASQRTQALALLRRRGMTRLAQFNAAGITATTISRMERAGEVVLLSRGLCQLPDAELATQQSLADAARLVPKGVICLASALAFHGLTERCIRRGTYRSTQALEKSIRQYVDLNNEDPKLSVWT